MNINRYSGLLLPLLMLVTQASYAETTSLWQDIPSALKSTEVAADFKHRRLLLDEDQLNVLIEETQQGDSTSAVSLSLPLPDGTFVAAKMIPDNLKCPGVEQGSRTMSAWHIESSREIISGRAEVTPLGFHVMLRTRNNEQIFIEPEQRTTIIQNRNYHSHRRQDNAELDGTQQRLSCGVTQGANFQWQPNSLNSLYSKAIAQRAGENMLTYRLAVAATGEYTRQIGGTQADAKEKAQSAIFTTINRVNEIFERELSLKFCLVDNTDIIFTNPNTDPYPDNDTGQMLEKNQDTLDKLVGPQNYDIGHVLGSVGGGYGLAATNIVCDNNTKAYGTTSASSMLLSDAFIIDFVAHELGHQLGATHTFNSNNSGSCSTSNRTAYTAHEPGSGSTIMSYAGICGSNDFQNHVDPQFHPTSILQIRAHTHDGIAASCATTTSLNNKLPTVNAGADYTIPARTPFILDGSASDSNGDTLLYSWDQIDAGDASSLGVDTGNNALIKSSALAVSPVRNVPDINRLLSLSQASSHGESLPRSNRKLNFRLTVRDGKGAASYDDKRLTIVDTGERFEIISPGSNISAGSQQITWNVAGTDQTPINCSQVDIAYTNDQGKTFTDLLANTANDGSATVQLDKTAQHIRVKCRNNIFFALSGTAPHIATYNGDSSQTSNSDNGGSNNGSDNDSGGGGSLPTGLLAIISLLALLRRKSIPTTWSVS
ncbi:MAG: M12 family metallo-peptidase [Thiolinea sp.]